MARDTEETEELQAAIDRLGIAIYAGRPARGELRPYIAFSYVADYEDAPNKEQAFMDDIATLLTAYAAQAADSKRLDAVEQNRWSVSHLPEGEEGPAIWYCNDSTDMPLPAWGDAYPTVRAAIDAALSGTETTAL